MTNPLLDQDDEIDGLWDDSEIYGVEVAAASWADGGLSEIYLRVKDDSPMGTTFIIRGKRLKIVEVAR